MLNRTDMKILSHLRQNSRETLTRISRLTKIPISTIYDKLKGNEQGVILKHTALIDFSKLGFNTRVNLLIKVNKKQRDELRSYLMTQHQVNSVFRINNGYDFLMEGIFREIKDLEDFNERLEDRFDIKGKQTYFIIDEIQRESFLSQPELLDLHCAYR